MREIIKKPLRKLFKVKDKQMFSYHKYPLNFLRRSPDFIIIGSQKAATSSLHSYLSEHSHIYPSLVKELHFFNMHYDRGMNYFKSFFPIGHKDKLTFETTPDYIDHPLAPQLCHQHFPNVKLILTVRDPVKRAFSHFNFVQGWDEKESKLTFEDGLAKEKERMEKAHELMKTDRYNSAIMFSYYGYTRKGEYARHLENWLKYYSLENIHIIDFEDIKKNIDQVIENLCSFIGIPVEPVKSEKRENVTRYNSEMDSETKEKLVKHFADHNRQFFQLIGKEFLWM